MQTLRIVFMGTPDFAVPCLQTLLDSPHNVVGVFTQPDKPQGRKMVLTPPPVKVLAAENGVPVFQPEKMKDPATLEQLKVLDPDLIVVVAYGRILPRAVLELPRYGCINVHASLLPKYRGAAPIQWAILDGETETGVTIMQMDAGLDTGDMLLVKKTPIDPEETAEMLFERLSALGAQALAEILPRLDDLHPVPQPAGDFGYAKMISKSMSPLDWNRSAAQLHDQVRGLYSWPCATTTIVCSPKRTKGEHPRCGDREQGQIGCCLRGWRRFGTADRAAPGEESHGCQGLFGWAPGGGRYCFRSVIL